MADVAVEFLLENLKLLLLHHAHLITDAKEHVEKLENDLRLFKSFLKDSTKNRKKDEKQLELVRQIREVVYEAEDIIDAFVTQAVEARSQNYFIRAFKGPLKLHSIGEKVQPVLRKIDDIYRRTVDFATIKVDDGEPEANEAQILRETNVVGFEDEAIKLKGYLNEKTQQLDVISIIGMPGLGKTTLARKIFLDPEIQYEFPDRIWVYVSQEFTKKNIFLDILKQVSELTEDVYGKSDEDLARLVAAHLQQRKFLLVMDDVWSIDDWSKLQSALPEKGKVLITSRQVEVGRHVNRSRDPHMLRFLTLEESCELLRWEIFGKLEFPLELEVEEKTIAHQCGGLPLAIVVIGGVIFKRFGAPGDPMTVMKNALREVAESVSAYIKYDTEKRMEKIISLSYENLPYQMRECFLYFGLFPEDSEIPAWRLIRLWIAEGLIKREADISLEETAESYLVELMNRNLVRPDKFKADGKVKTCRIHDMLRDLCKNEAADERENFLQEIKSCGDGFQPEVSERVKHRRLCIHSDVVNFLCRKPFCPSVRSFVCLSKDEIHLPTESTSAIPAGFKLLRVLDVKPIKFNRLPSDMYHLLHLRYIALSFNSKILPQAFSKLWNIQTLIVDTNSRTLDIKADILNMTQLRHFKTNASATLPKTSNSKGGEKIQTLGMISPESCTKEVLGSTHNLKKLGVRGRLDLLLEDRNGSFDSLGKLGNLENLKLTHDVFSVPHPGVQLRLPPAYKFPAKLRSLTLSGTSLEWRHMSVLGALESLEVLKLKDRAFCGESWKATDGGFRQLEVLRIGRTNLAIWGASHHHFPRLKRLELRNCENLKEVPFGLAEIPSFQILDLYRCKHAGPSAKKIHEAKKKQKEQSANVRAFKLFIFPPDPE